MSDQEKKEQEIMNQEMSKDEMETVAGGYICWASHNYPLECSQGTHEKYVRPILKPEGTVNCANTVEDGSHCEHNDACYENEICYYNLKECGKAWM